VKPVFELADETHSLIRPEELFPTNVHTVLRSSTNNTTSLAMSYIEPG